MCRSEAGSGCNLSLASTKETFPLEDPVFLLLRFLGFFSSVVALSKLAFLDFAVFDLDEF
jgi:hypothetical protein